MSNNPRAGCYVTQNTAGEAFRAYVPAPLPLSPALELHDLMPLLEKASIAVSTLNASISMIPNPMLFVTMYVHKEALLSSQIEGTQSSFSDVLLFENKQKPNVSLEDVEEVSHYVRAIYHGIYRMREDDFPLSLRLLREMHAILLSGGRGSKQSPGEFRKSQNWIGGTRLGNALFVPPPVSHLMDCLSNFELFLHDNTLPVLVKAAIAHVQFETIHPFLDGNGRLGRLLISLLFIHHDILSQPVLYLSLYLKQNRSRYYALLQEVREYGRWEVWIEFFLKAVVESANQAISTTHALNKLFTKHEELISRLGKIRASCELVFEFLKKLPQVTVSVLNDVLDLSPPTIRASLSELEKLGIVEKKTAKERNKIYVYKAYLSLLEEGAEPL